jgi:uncharacterized repeat protein (TIGR01451 family)
MKNYLLIIFFISFALTLSAQCNNQGLSPNSGFRGQTLTTLITNNQLFFGNGSAPCSPSEVYLYHASTGTTINASTLSINNDSVRVSWNIPANAPVGGYDLYLSEWDYSTVNGNCIIGPVQCTTNQAFEINASQITGSVFYDDNLDSVYNGLDVYLPSQKLMLLPDSIITFTDANGNYTFWADTGMHTIKIINSSDFYSVNSDSNNINITSQNISGVDFALYPNTTAFNTTTFLTGKARCNTTQRYNLIYDSYTIIPVNLVIKYYSSSNLSVANTTIPPDSSTGDTLYFSVYNFIYGTGIIGLDINIPAAGNSISGTSVVETYDLNSNLVSVDTFHLNQVVSCLLVPNGKSVTPEGYSSQHYTLFGETLFYTINFQNVGSDTAYTIEIKDTIDSDLDLNSLRIISSSHPVIPEVLPGGIIDFHFYNIMLPDSDIDEPSSNGYISYIINAQQGLPELTPVDNTAYIYFDQSSAVATNTTENILTSDITIGISEISNNNSLTVYPNPFNSIITVSDKNNLIAGYRMNIYDLQGRLIFIKILNGNNISLDLHSLSQGCYFFRINDRDGKLITNGKLIRQ